jgi:hypothetical protein
VTAAGDLPLPRRGPGPGLAVRRDHGPRGLESRHVDELPRGAGAPMTIAAGRGRVHYARRMDRVRPSAIRDLLRLGADPDVISFGGDYPDPSLFPVAKL